MQSSTSSAAPRTSRTPSHLSNASSSSPSPPSSSSLPTEILVHILKLATAGLSFLERQQTRMKFGNVSRAWYNSCRDASSELVVDGSQRAKRLAKTLAEEKKSRRGISRRVISLVLLDEGSPRTGRGDRFAALVKQVPNLLSFTFSCTAPLGKRFDSLGAPLRAAVLRMSSLERFTLYGLYTSGMADADLRKLLLAWPRLRQLNIPYLSAGNGSSQASFALPSPTIGLSCTLDFLESIPAQSATDLHSLDMVSSYVHLGQDVQFARAISPLASTIVHLKLPSISLGFFGSPVGSLHHPLLETLTSVERLTIPLSLIDPLTIFPSLKKLQHLDELTFLYLLYDDDYTGDSPTSSDVVDLNQTAPVLKRLTIPRQTIEQWGGDEEKAVKLAAAEAGIVLVQE